MNKYQTFHFKKFEIVHQNSAMKIGTDGILLGAWANLDGCKSLLDVGTGSGLVALMCAQRYHKLNIRGIDIDQATTEQAKENFNKSPFKERLDTEFSSLENFCKKKSNKFDAIVSNPPYFKNSLKGDNEQRTLARHSDQLSLHNLFRDSAEVLLDHGKFIMIYPFDQLEDILQNAKLHQFHLHTQLDISHNENKKPKRVLLEFRYKEVIDKVTRMNFYIRDLVNNYSEEYIQLTKDFHPFL